MTDVFLVDCVDDGRLDNVIAHVASTVENAVKFAYENLDYSDMLNHFNITREVVDSNDVVIENCFVAKIYPSGEFSASDYYAGVVKKSAQQSK
jgi:hypothetical protein